MSELADRLEREQRERLHKPGYGMVRAGDLFEAEAAVTELIAALRREEERFGEAITFNREYRRVVEQMRDALAAWRVLGDAVSGRREQTMTALAAADEVLR
jgi:hypothetical protein